MASAPPPPLPPLSPPVTHSIPQPPPRSSNRTLWLVLGIVGGVVLLVGGGVVALVLYAISRPAIFAAKIPEPSVSSPIPLRADPGELNAPDVKLVKTDFTAAGLELTIDLPQGTGIKETLGGVRFTQGKDFGFELECKRRLAEQKEEWTPGGTIHSEDGAYTPARFLINSDSTMFGEASGPKALYGGPDAPQGLKYRCVTERTVSYVVFSFWNSREGANGICMGSKANCLLALKCAATLVPRRPMEGVAVLQWLGVKIEKNDKGEVPMVFLDAHMSDAVLPLLKDLPGLEQIMLSGDVTDAGLPALAHLPRLERLHISETRITDEGFRELAKLRGLTTLSISGNGESSPPYINGSNLSALLQLPKLEDLNLSGTHVNDATLAPLKDFTGLKTLALSKPMHGDDVGRVSDATCRNIAALSNLATLDLSGTDVTDAGVGQLALLVNLTELDLSNTAVTDVGMPSLARLTNLRTLKLKNTRITDAGLKALHGLTEMSVLDLQETAITDEGLAELKGFTKLSALSLGKTRVTDAGLVHLYGLKSLYFLARGDTAITDAGEKKFNEARAAKPTDQTDPK
ncbi:MAG: inlA 3 [Phycisphaerales bacterium]|nr:inlA 3 [Phycisphaerales bacterium]